MSKSKKIPTYKIAVLGLSNAGKTSILKTLTREFDILTIIKPTVNIERMHLEFLGNDLIIWDFGGQENYRSKYLSTPERFFQEIHFIFYVVDIQAPELLTDSILYFNAVYENTHKYSPPAKFVIIFHKFDPQMKNPEIAKNIEEKFMDAVMQQIDPSIQLQMYYSSIYNPLTVVRAISQPLFDNKEIKNNLTNVFRSFCETYQLVFISLLTESLFEIASYKKEPVEAAVDKTIELLFKEFFTKYNPKAFPPNFMTFKGRELDFLSGKFFVQEFAEGPKSQKTFTIIFGYTDQSVMRGEQLQTAVEIFILNLQKILMNTDLSNLLPKY